MGVIFKIMTFVFISLFSLNVMAADDVGNYPISSVINSNDAETRLGSTVQFYFGDHEHPNVIKSLGKVETTNRTSAFWKNDSDACRWAFLASLKSRRDKAMTLGGNAVINIKSNVKSVESSSQINYRCAVGFLMANTALTGEIVKI
jgi:uncharacterized protein YbjQ (UPF0145 family)